MYELLDIDAAKCVATVRTYGAAIELGREISRHAPATRFALVWYQNHHAPPDQIARFEGGKEFLLTNIAGTDQGHFGRMTHTR